MILLDIYKKWDDENPYDLGEGWGSEPWSQKEMPLSDDVAGEAARESASAVVIIGRTAGEEQDSKLEKGSYYLTDTETEMLKTVRKHFGRMIVLLNVGGIIDLSFLDDKEISPDALMIVWHGGMIGGTGTAKVLLGDVSPSGKLPDTIAYNVFDHASDRNFGSPDKCVYAEDIYVGYRYFETFARDKVRYPFGYGMSYTDFSTVCDKAELSGNCIEISVTVTNIGDKYSGKQVVQLYYEAPQGNLGKPARVLKMFSKTDYLAPGASQSIKFSIHTDSLCSYDDSGKSGYKNCFVLEAGEYNFYVGSDVRTAAKCFSFTLDETRKLSQHKQLLAPHTAFDRIVPDNGKESSEPVPLNENDVDMIISEHLPAEIQQTGDKGIKLADVKGGKNTIHSKEEKLALVKRNLEGETTIALERETGIYHAQIHEWTKRYLAGGEEALVNKKKPGNPLAKYTRKKELTYTEELEYKVALLERELLKKDGEIVRLKKSIELERGDAKRK